MFSERMVSIVLPTFNGEKYLMQSINSVLAQTYTNFELIIVNDNSNDSTESIIIKYMNNDNRIKYIKNEKNEKLPKSLNIGFAHANGDFFTWTSDDNIMYHDAIEKMVSALIATPTASFVYAREEFIDENGKKIGERPRLKDADELYCNNIISACFLYKRELHKVLNGYNTEMFLVEDFDFFRRAYMLFKFIYISEILYSYRIHKNSLTATKRIDIARAKLKILECDDINKYPKHIKDKINREISNTYFALSGYIAQDLIKSNEIKNIYIYKTHVLLRKFIKSFFVYLYYIICTVKHYLK